MLGTFDLMVELDEMSSSLRALAWHLYPPFHLTGFCFQGCATVISGTLKISTRFLPRFITKGRIKKFGKLNTCKSSKK